MTCLTAGVSAQFATRAEFSLHGDAVMIGNTMGHDGASGTPAPIVGVVGTLGTNTTDSAPDVFWRADSPSNGFAQANTAITSADARTTAVLTLPGGSTVRYARLYWSAKGSSGSPDNTVSLERPSVFSNTVTADFTSTGSGNVYTGTANVTALVQANGSGAYRLGGMDIINWVNLADDVAFAGWGLVVVYELASEPLRKIEIKDGPGIVTALGSTGPLVFDGFTYDNMATPKLSILAFEGDNTITGDSLSVNAVPLTNALNAADNFFNSTHSALGIAVNVDGDLPRLTGAPGSGCGIDLDTVSLAGSLTANAISYSVAAQTSSDEFMLAALVSSVPTLPASPNLTSRVRLSLKGDALVIGNTLGQDVATGVGIPLPIVGAVGTTGTNTADLAPDVFWRSDAPGSGSATANSTITAANARSSAHLQMPVGSSLRHARLYWAATGSSATPDTTVTFEREGFFSTTVTADTSYTGTGNVYQGTADVTDLVRTHGTGAYRLGGMDIINWVNLDNGSTFAGWALVVVYERASDPWREIEIMDGLGRVTPAGVIGPFTFEGFRFNNQGDAKLTLLAYKGDSQLTGDSLFINSQIQSDATNPATNFFNSTRTAAGVAATTSGDLPWLTGAAGSLSGIDLDTIICTAAMAGSPYSSVVTLQTTSDNFLIGALVSSVPSYPDPSELLQLSIEAVAGQPLQKNLVITPAFSDYSYEVDFSTTLDSWDPLTGVTSNLAGEVLTITDLNATESRKFYRVRANAPW